MTEGACMRRSEPDIVIVGAGIAGGAARLAPRVNLAAFDPQRPKLIAAFTRNQLLPHRGNPQRARRETALSSRMLPLV